MHLGSSVHPIFAAWQDGNGSWKKLDPVNGGYSFAVTDSGGRYSVALAMDPSVYSTQFMEVWQATVDELPDIVWNAEDFSANSSANSYAVNGSITGYAASESVFAYMSHQAQGTSASQPNFAFSLPAGVYDLFVTGSERCAIVRNVSVASSTTLPTLDLNAQAQPFGHHQVAIQGLDAQESGFWMTYLQTSQANGLLAPLGSGSFASPSFDTPTLAPSQQLLSDLYIALLGTADRTVYQSINLSGTPTITLPSSLAAPTLGYSGGAPEIQCQWAASPGTTFYTLTARQDPFGDHLQTLWHVTLTPRWLGASPSYLQPNLDGLQSSALSWRFTRSQSLHWALMAFTTSGGPNDPYAPVNHPQLGESLRMATQAGILSPAGTVVRQPLDPRSLLQIPSRANLPHPVQSLPIPRSSGTF